MNRSIALGVCVVSLAVTTVASFDACGQINPGLAHFGRIRPDTNHFVQFRVAQGR